MNLPVPIYPTFGFYVNFMFRHEAWHDFYRVVGKDMMARAEWNKAVDRLVNQMLVKAGVKV